MNRLRAGGDCESADLIVADPKRIKAASESFRLMSSLGDKAPDQTQVWNMIVDMILALSMIM